MNGRLVLLFAGLLLLMSYGLQMGGKLVSEQQPEVVSEASSPAESLAFPQEVHLKNVKQLTFGGDNAEAYWSFNDQMLSFQYRNLSEGLDCDQIYWADVNDKTFAPHMISNGKGRTTCAYFLPDNKHVLYASTFATADSCLHDPDRSHGYLWGVYPSYEIYISDLQGHIVSQLTDNDYYDAEATISPKGDKIVFTSDRSGDLELWTMNLDGSDLKQITSDLGYDGGAFFSPDGSKIVFRASRPSTPEAQKEYKDLLKTGYVRPNEMELFICNADGSDLRQITELGGANWAPFFHPSGNKIIFSSNHVTKRIPFNLFMINTDGTGLEQITYDEVFDSFAMFSYDGKKIVFGSNRNNHGTRDTNLFMADWED